MRFLDKFLVVLALLMFGQALFRAVVEKGSEFGTLSRRPPPAVEAPREPSRALRPDEQPAPRRLSRQTAMLPPISERDPVIGVNPSQPRQANQRSIGTAFAVGRDGAWLTAKHVIDDCNRVLIRRGNAWDTAAVDFADAVIDIAVLRARAGVPLLPVTAGPLGIGEDGYAFGFAGQGGPSAIHATLLGRARTVHGGRNGGSTPVLAWAEREWLPPGERWIGGMSGGPLTTQEGAVAGIMSVASERRGRIYTVAPEVIGRVMRDRGLAFTPAVAAPVAADHDSFDRARAELMNRRTVVQVLCTG